jgi:hypothetical protein
MPPESADISAKRFAPENAFGNLSKALSMFPDFPKSLLVPDRDRPKINEGYSPEPDSIGFYLGVHRPDDDPEFLTYAENCKPALDIIHESMKQPYFLIPLHWKDEDFILGESKPPFQTSLSILFRCNRNMFAYGARQALNGNDSEGFQYLIDSLRLSLFLDSAFDENVYQLWYSEIKTFPLVNKIVVTASSETLRKTIQDSLSLKEHIASGEKNLEFLFRKIDISIDSLDINLTSQNKLKSFAITVIYAYIYKEIRIFCLSHKEEFFGLFQKPFIETKNILRKYENSPHSRFDMSNLVIYKIEQILESRADARIAFDGLALLCALELYKRDKATYPDSLDQLSPDYISSLPLDPFSDKAYIYARKSKDDFTLYSVGKDGQDGGGVKKSRSTDIVIRGVDPNGQ